MCLRIRHSLHVNFRQTTKQEKHKHDNVLSFFVMFRNNEEEVITISIYGTGICPVCPRELRAVHHCSSSLLTIYKISPFLKGKSSAS
jgi:hypothetical protein